MTDLGSEPAKHGGLPATLSLLDTTMLVMGGIVGAGIFFTPSNVAAIQPSLAGILLVWGLGGVLALTGAFVFAELGALFPRTGGQYVYLREGLGPHVAFFYGWCLLTIVVSGAIAVVTNVCIYNLAVVLAAAGISLSPTVRLLLGIVVLLVFTWTNVRGVKLGAVVHNVFMALKILSILLIVVLGIGWLFGPGPHGLASGGTGVRFELLAPALLPAMFAFGGWQNAAAVSGEIKNAAHVVPRAILLGTMAVIVLYLTLNLAVVEILGIEDLGAAKAGKASVALAAGRALGDAGEVLVALMIVLSTIGIIHALLLMTPRICYAMAADGVFFDACARRHPRHATPYVAIIAFGLLSVLHLVLASTASGWDIDRTLRALVFVDWVFYSLGGVCYFVFRRRLCDVARPYRAPGHPWIPGIFLALSLAIVFGTIYGLENHQDLLMPAIVFTIGGVLLWFRMGR